MASDNVTLNAGSGGAVVRTFADASGSEWPAAVAAYVTTASPGANVLQPVQVGSGLPVKQDGTWNVGAVTSITNPVGVAAGANLIGMASAGADTSTVYSGATSLTPMFAAVAASAAGDNQIVAAVAGKRIRVLRWGLTANGTTSVKWRSSTTSDLTGVRPLTQYASAGGSYAPVGIFQTVAGEALTLNLSAAVAVGGEVTYIEV